jgi:potassium-transporting ATPase KdpC subunit
MEYIKQSLKLTLICVIIFSAIYPLLLWSIGRLVPVEAEGKPMYNKGVIIGYENIGQVFNKDKYFNSRPSAVNYDASASGASNYGYTNPDFQNLLKNRIDTFLVHNPNVHKNEIPVDIITSSGSGLDPHISYEAALIQVSRIAKTRNIDKSVLMDLLVQYLEKPFIGIYAKPKVNVLKLNIALDNLDSNYNSVKK